MGPDDAMVKETENKNERTPNFSFVSKAFPCRLTYQNMCKDSNIFVVGIFFKISTKNSAVTFHLQRE